MPSQRKTNPLSSSCPFRDGRKRRAFRRLAHMPKAKEALEALSALNWSHASLRHATFIGVFLPASIDFAQSERSWRSLSSVVGKPGQSSRHPWGLISRDNPLCEKGPVSGDRAPAIAGWSDWRNRLAAAASGRLLSKIHGSGRSPQGRPLSAFEGSLAVVVGCFEALRLPQSPGTEELRGLKWGERKLSLSPWSPSARP